MGECFAHGRYMGGGMCPKCAELGAKGAISGRKERGAQFRYTDKGRCRWCGKKVKKPRRTWCSQECVDKYRIRSDPGFVRSQVKKRDKGICALCGVDTLALGRELRDIESRANQALGKRGEYRNGPDGAFDWFDYSPDERAGRRAAAAWLKAEASWILQQRGIEPGAFPTSFQTPWEADHIVPVAEGGGGCGLDNYRTLCVPCHKSESARLAAYRARKRAEEAKAEEDRIRPRLPYVD